MPATSRNQRIATAIAEHEPDKLYARNKAMLGMTKQQLHDFASTKEKGLPEKVRNTMKPSSKRGLKRASGPTVPLRAALRARQ